jgi:lysophospholipase L1-like esterase
MRRQEVVYDEQDAQARAKIRACAGAREPRRTRIRRAVPPAAVKLLIASAVTLGALGLVEAALRAGGFAYAPAAEPLIVRNRLGDREFEHDAALHRIDPDTLWSPRPLAPVPEGAAEGERINADGFRGPQRARAKPAGALRVVALGDSSTFGYGLAYVDTWPAQLEALLASGGRAAEVLDLGILGGTALQGLERYRTLGRLYRPDVVVAAFGAANEHQPATGGTDAEKLARLRADETVSAADWLLGHSRAAQLVRWLGDGRPDEESADRESSRSERFEEWQAEAEQNAGKGAVDWPGRRRVALDEFDALLAALAQEVAADGARLVLVSMPRERGIEHASPVLLEYTRRVEECAARLGLALADAHAAFESKETQRAAGERLLLPDDAIHPSRAGNGLIARLVAERL